MRQQAASAAADTFESHRSQLIGLAYRLTGLRSEAEDIVQEAFLKWLPIDHGAIESPYAWLAKVVTRKSLDCLKSARVQRMSYVGPWLPEPFLMDERTPEETLEIDESISIAFLLLLEQLSPAERAAFILHDLFHFSFSEIADILKRTVGSCRKLASRARGKVTPDITSAPKKDDHLQMLNAFFDAVKEGDMAGLIGLLKENATLTTDGGGKAVALRDILRGSAAVTKFFLKAVRADMLSAKHGEMTFHTVWFNGAPGLLACRDGRPVSAFSLVIEDGLIEGIFALRNPDKLSLFGTLPLIGPNNKRDPSQA